MHICAYSYALPPYTTFIKSDHVRERMFVMGYGGLRPSEYRRRQKRRRQRSAFILVLILCVLFFFLGRCSSSSVYLDVVDPGSAPSASPVSNGSANGNELLTLVNSKHPLPSGWKVSLVQLKNGQSIDRRAYAALQDMMDDARRAGLSPLICSSYRTRAKQEELHKNQVQKFLSEGYSQSMAEQKASQWVAPPGTSEHELGLAVDIVATDHQLLDETQEHTPEQKWLMENCWKYGFILRYPTSKSSITGIGYEPWHYRYVGKDAAKQIMEQGICLEEYLNQV